MSPKWIQPPPQWDLAALAADAAAVLKARADALLAEQATCGIDDLDEPALHALLAEGLAARGYDVRREAHYPADAAKSTASRLRCDLLLTRPGMPDLAPLWLEVKRSWQFEEDTAHRGYAAQLMQHTVRDVRKLRADDGIDRAAVMLIAFGSDAVTLAHDLAAFEQTCDRKGAPLAPGHTVTLPIPDRIGHTLAAVACWRVR
jgi:hypothetical protein